MTTHYVVRLFDGPDTGPFALVVNTRDGETSDTYSRRWSGRDYKAQARDQADRLNASDARVAWNAAHENLLPYAESQDYQRDMEG